MVNYTVSLNKNWWIEDVENKEEALKEVLKSIDFLNVGITRKDFIIQKNRK